MIIGWLCGTVCVCFALCVFSHIRVCFWRRQPPSCLASLLVTQYAVRILTIFTFLCGTTEYTAAWWYLADALWKVFAYSLAEETRTFKFLFVLYFGVFPLFSFWILKWPFPMQCSFVTASSHCWWGCGGRVALLMHVEPPAAFSPASEKLHRIYSPFCNAPNNHRGHDRSVKETLSLADWCHSLILHLRRPNWFLQSTWSPAWSQRGVEIYSHS